MGDRYIFPTVPCPTARCGEVLQDVYYAPTCGITTVTCFGCGYVIDLAEVFVASVGKAGLRGAVEREEEK